VFINVTTKQIQLKQIDMALGHFESYFSNAFEKFIYEKTED